MNELIKKTVNNLSIPVKVMIRPQGCHFIYSAEELEEIKDSFRVIR